MHLSTITPIMQIKHLKQFLYFIIILFMFNATCGADNLSNNYKRGGYQSNNGENNNYDNNDIIEDNKSYDNNINQSNNTSKDKYISKNKYTPKDKYTPNDKYNNTSFIVEEYIDQDNINQTYKNQAYINQTDKNQECNNQEDRNQEDINQTDINQADTSQEDIINYQSIDDIVKNHIDNNSVANNRTEYTDYPSNNKSINQKQITARESINQKQIVVDEINVSDINQFAKDVMLINNYQARNHDDLWERLRSGFRMSQYIKDPMIQEYERKFANNPKVVYDMLNGAKFYLYYVLNEVEKSGMPSEIALLPAIESEFKPFAISCACAGGLWQIMPSLGRDFNLTQDRYIDERFHLIKSTKAAMRYLNYLHNLFQYWDLALIAYHSGQGNVYRAMLKNGDKLGTHAKYSELKLGPKTRSYVPKLLALANIVNNPQKYGIALQQLKNQPYFHAIIQDKNINSTKLIKQHKSAAEIFYELNSHFKKNNRSNILIGQGHQVFIPIVY